MDWIQTHSGKAFYPFQPRPEDIDIEDIAHALAHQCRFGGHVSKFYSVAQHCVLLARVLQAQGFDRMTIFAGLMHDATEAYLVDLPRPVKNMLPSYRDAENRLAAAIAEKFGLPPVEPAIVKEYDTRILRNEAEVLLGEAVDGWWDHIVPLPIQRIEPWEPRTAKAFFRDWFKWCAEEYE